jgi:tRNA-dihydrouridine synthase B
MKDNFWQKLPQPFFALAPMDDITDFAFREMLVRHGKPDVMYTEFVSADGLMSAGREVLLRKLKYTEAERPIVAQIFGAKPETIRGAAALIRELGFDGVDINMGCPDKTVMKQGAGAALIEKPELAREILRAAKEGAEAAGNGGQAKEFPVSVKTRLGVKTDILDKWLPVLLEERPAAITIHCRTVAEMSKGVAHWNRIADAVFAAHRRNEGGRSSFIRIIGNGDVGSIEEGRERAVAAGADGVMLGRAAIGNPFVFSGKKPTTEELLAAMVEHAELYERTNEDSLPSGRETSFVRFEPIRKHLSKYCHGMRGAKELREKVLRAKSAEEVRKVVYSREV